jgi:tyrosyl-tRNA synthetase
MEYLERAVEAIFPNQEALRARLHTGTPLKIYWGIDPTGPSLHLGHLSVLLKLRDFQAAGHDIILLIGDFTAMIGDPTDKQAARVQLSSEAVAANMRLYRKQFSRILDIKKLTIKKNSQWLKKLGLQDVLTLASELTVGQLLERDMFAKRLAEGKPIYFHEFFYPMLQGYDSVQLGVDLEIGGNDQTFNMLVGRDMQKRRGQEKFVLATKLLVDPTGKKMGKSEGNMVSFTDTPADAYGKIMSWPDSLLPLAYEICTRLPLAPALTRVTSDPLAAKKALAREIVTLLHGAAAAKRAENTFATTFQNKEVPPELLQLPTQPGALLVDVLVNSGVVESRSEFHRLLRDGAITDLAVGKVTDANLAINFPGKFKIGKKRFVELVITN